MKQNNVHENGKYSTGCKKTDKIRHDNTKHYPNKDEASLLRKIMTDTGLCEEEVRSIKKYRVMLSEAQKAGQKAKRGRVTKWVQSKIKQACKRTGLVPQHPETINVLDELLKIGYSWGHFPWCMNRINAETAVRYYASRVKIRKN